MRIRSVLVGVVLLLAALLAIAPPGMAQESPSAAAVEPPQAGLPAMPAGGKDGTAHVNGVDIHYVVYGSGDPVILLHGGLANGTYWANQIPALAGDHQVIVVDSRA